MKRVFLISFTVLVFILTSTRSFAISSAEIDELLTPSPIPHNGVVMQNDEYTLELKDGPAHEAPDDRSTNALLTDAQQAQLNTQKAVVYQTLEIPHQLQKSSDSLPFSVMAGKQIRTLPLSLELRQNSPGFARLIARTSGPLSSESGHRIDQTSCDDESHPCTPDHEAAWTQDTSYGWGVSIASRDTKTENARFKPVSDQHVSTLIPPVYVDSTYRTILNFKIVTAPDTPESMYQTMVLLYLLPY